MQTLQITDKIDDDEDSNDENKIPFKNEKEKDVLFLKNSDLKFEFQLWKKKNGLPMNKRIFIINGNYKDIEESLLRRGIKNFNKNILN